VGFKRSGKRHILHFPALVQRRRMTVWGLSLIAGADRVRHGTAPSKSATFASSSRPMNGAAWRNAASVALPLHGCN
jgi:hypothetical protein